MVVAEFRKRSFKRRLKDTGYLLAHSFTLFGRERDLKKPTIKMAIFSIITTTFFFASILIFSLKKYDGVAIILLLIFLFFLVPKKFFYYAKQKSIQSWIAYCALRRTDVTYSQAKSSVRAQKKQIKGIALVSFILSIGGSGNTKGIAGAIKHSLLMIFREVWDLLKHYMIPAVVIEGKKLRECIGNIKSLKQNIPAALVGVFGIDFAGGIISSFIFMIGLPLIAISIWVSVKLSSIIPAFVIIYLVIVIGSIMNKFVQSVKVVYFTILYTSINRPEEISEDIREDVTNYLLMEGKNVEQTQSYVREESKENHSIELKQWVEQYLAAGYTKDQMRTTLLENGHSLESIESVFNVID